MNLKELFTLFWSFFRIGGLTFGGGYSMIPMLKKEVVEKYNWISEDELLDYYAIGQATPGAIAINTAVFVGNRKMGILGGIFATLGVVTPSFIIIMSIASIINEFSGLIVVQNAFSGIRIVVSALILKSLLDIMKKSINDKFGVGLFIFSFLISFIVSPVYLVLTCGLVGFLYYRKKEDE
ncbi:MAG: chromate transporter [Peptostreptococcaceae bacterium]